MYNTSVIAFLSEIKKLIASGRWQFVTRTYKLSNGSTQTYLQALFELDIDHPNDVPNEILKLTPLDYYSGPEDDRDRNNGTKLWIFKKNINGITTYIKLKIDERGCVCVSFHKDR